METLDAIVLFSRSKDKPLPLQISDGSRVSSDGLVHNNIIITTNYYYTLLALVQQLLSVILLLIILLIMVIYGGGGDQRTPHSYAEVTDSET